MTQTLIPPATARASSTILRYGLYVLAYVALTLLLAFGLRDGARRDLTFVNDSNWDLRVEAVSADGSSTPLVTVDAHRSEKIDDVWKSGPTWRFRWSYSPEQTQTTTISDHSLASQSFRTEAPAELVASLQADGVPPSQ
ncbi:MAG TPA: hypothetical protein VGH94_13935 [Acidimicrobiales bacterium]|jgi:hypothetical protein